MSDDTLTIDGKTYLSSIRAAELVGYTKDYVGQLARSGKIDAKRIGRMWYVHDGSIMRHKVDTHYTLTRPKKTSQITEKATKNNDISSTDAADASSVAQDGAPGTDAEPEQEVATPLFPEPRKQYRVAQRELVASSVSFESGANESQTMQDTPPLLHKRSASHSVRGVESHDADERVVTMRTVQAQDSDDMHRAARSHSDVSIGRGSSAGTQRARTTRPSTHRGRYRQVAPAPKRGRRSQGGRRTRAIPLVSAVLFAFVVGIVWFVASFSS